MKSPRPKKASVACGNAGCDRRFASERGARQHRRSCPQRRTVDAEPERFQCADCGGFPGPVETQTRRDVSKIASQHPVGAALAEMAFALARRLDASRNLEAAESRAIGAISKELRATVVELARLGVGDDDDLEDELSTPTA